jgi:hypothetical protein
MGIHAAADTEYEWPFYGKLVGAYFESHPNDPNVLTAQMRVLDPNHPATKNLPLSWTRADEWYNYKNINPAIKVLINLEEDSYSGGTNGAKPSHCLVPRKSWRQGILYWWRPYRSFI